ncbi:BIR protein [Plasmodium berghei]|uniref:BIR protein n=2 Tax=Plasmodium berghei TaxID=5821 RepID=A0A509AF59_PLABA|nr:BIR protein [Plasmodium berghei ANKA]CXI87270.1 BIR protein [Plasmodium berghei]VUC54221.1 BIR protein [Plasmodium berghei ANKA]|eukprot:XP_034420059.1 BIR protein [Plasmodium berghei ANKA]
MDKNLCNNFIYVTTNLEYDSNNKNYKFKDDTHFKDYCPNKNCNTDLEKISAGCLYFLYTFFGSSDLFKSVANSNIDIVEYIMMWLSYMLNLKENTSSSISHLEHFYKTYINNDKYQKPITGVTEYNSYKDLVDKKKYLLDMDSNIISNFYEAFKLLCKMYTEFDESTSNCTNCSQYSKTFAEKYEELNKKSDIANNSSYKQLLYTLSNDYNNLKTKCKNCLSLPEIETSIYALTSEDTSSSSIGNKLFTVLSIFGAIAFFLGISYKYSLFGFRKRAQKQYLREKIKNIKKRMNH